MDFKERLEKLNRLVQLQPSLFLPNQIKELQTITNAYKQNPEQIEQLVKQIAIDNEDDGLIESALKTVGQLPLGFAEGFTTLNVGLNAPKTPIQSIARRVGQLFGFIGYVPNPYALTARAAIKVGSKATAKKVVGKALGKSAEYVAKDSMKAVALQSLGKTNLLQFGGKTVKSIPMYMADKVTDVFKKTAVAKMGAEAVRKFPLLASQKAFLNPDNIIDMLRGGVHLGSASAISNLGINPFVWDSERFKQLPAAFGSSALFGASYRVIGNMGLISEKLMEAGQPILATKILQGITGALYQGLPSTLRKATTPDQFYDYLMGAWFGFHGMPNTFNTAQKYMMTMKHQYHTDPKLQGRNPIIDRNTKVGKETFKKVTGQSFDQYFKISDMKKAYHPEVGKAFESLMAKEYNPIPIEQLRKVPYQKSGTYQYEDELGNKNSLDYYYTNPYYQGKNQVIPKHGIMYVRDPKVLRELGRIRPFVLTDPYALNEYVQRVKKEGFKSKVKGVPHIPAGFFSSDQEIIEFIKAHEASHDKFKNEKTATGIGVLKAIYKTSNNPKEAINRIKQEELKGLLRDKNVREYYEFLKGSEPSYEKLKFHTENGRQVLNKIVTRRGERGYIIQSARDKERNQFVYKFIPEENVTINPKTGLITDIKGSAHVIREHDIRRILEQKGYLNLSEDAPIYTDKINLEALYDKQLKNKLSQRIGTKEIEALFAREKKDRDLIEKNFKAIEKDVADKYEKQIKIIDDQAKNIQNHYERLINKQLDKILPKTDSKDKSAEIIKRIFDGKSKDDPLIKQALNYNNETADLVNKAIKRYQSVQDKYNNIELATAKSIDGLSTAMEYANSIVGVQEKYLSAIEKEYKRIEAIERLLPKIPNYAQVPDTRVPSKTKTTVRPTEKAVTEKTTKKDIKPPVKEERATEKRKVAKEIVEEKPVTLNERNRVKSLIEQGKDIEEYVFHIGANPKIATEGLKAGGLTGKTPIFEEGYGDYIFVFKKDKLPKDFDSGKYGDVTSYKGWDPKKFKPDFIFSIHEFKNIKMGRGARADELGYEAEPEMPLTKAEIEAEKLNKEIHIKKALDLSNKIIKETEIKIVPETKKPVKKPIDIEYRKRLSKLMGFGEELSKQTPEQIAIIQNYYNEYSKNRDKRIKDGTETDKIQFEEFVSNKISSKATENLLETAKKVRDKSQKIVTETDLDVRNKAVLKKVRDMAINREIYDDYTSAKKVADKFRINLFGEEGTFGQTADILKTLYEMNAKGEAIKKGQGKAQVIEYLKKNIKEIKPDRRGVLAEELYGYISDKKNKPMLVRMINTKEVDSLQYDYKTNQLKVEPILEQQTELNRIFPNKGDLILLENTPKNEYVEAVKSQIRQQIYKTKGKVSEELQGIYNVIDSELTTLKDLKNYGYEIPGIVLDNYIEVPSEKGGLSFLVSKAALAKKANITQSIVKQGFSLNQVISGGQTGIDQLGLEVAKSLNIKTGGTAPAGYKTEKGNNLKLKEFGLTQDNSADYLPRTEKNVINSDGTIYFSEKGSSAGLTATRRFANIHKKPFLLNPTEEQIQDWLIKNNIKILNIAGNRGSKLSKESIAKVKSILENVFKQNNKNQDYSEQIDDNTAWQLLLNQTLGKEAVKKYNESHSIEKGLKYIKQFMNPRSILDMPGDIRVVVLDDDHPSFNIKKNAKNSLYEGEGELKSSRIDGFMSGTESLMKMLRGYFGVTEGALKINVAGADPEKGNHVVFKGALFPVNEISEIVDAKTKFPTLFVSKSASKIFFQNNKEIKPTTISKEDFYLGKGKYESYKIPKKYLGLIKDESTKWDSTFTTQIYDYIANNNSVKPYIDKYVKPHAEEFVHLKKAVAENNIPEINHMLLKIMGINNKTGEVRKSQLNDTSYTYVEQLLKGASPYSPFMKGQTEALLRKYMNEIIMPKHKDISHHIITPDMKGELQERRIVRDKNNKLVVAPGQAKVSTEVWEHKYDLNDLWLFDTKTNEYLPFKSYYPNVEHYKNMRLKDIVKKVEKDNLQVAMAWQRSPKQKTEDTIFFTPIGQLSRKEGNIFKGSSYDMYFSEADYDGDSLNIIPYLNKSMVKEFAYNIIDAKGKLKTGKTEIPPADYSRLDLNNYNHAMSVMKKAELGARNIGQHVSTRAVANAVVNSQLEGFISTTKGQHKFKYLSRENKAQIEAMNKYFAEIIQTSVDYFKADIPESWGNIKHRKDVLKEALGQDFSDTDYYLFNWVTEPIVNSIRGTKKQNFSSVKGVRNEQLNQRLAFHKAFENDPDRAIALRAYKDYLRIKNKNSTNRTEKDNQFLRWWDSLEKQTFYMDKIEQNNKTFNNKADYRWHREYMIDIDFNPPFPSLTHTNSSFLPTQDTRPRINKLITGTAREIDIPIIKLSPEAVTRIKSTPRYQLMTELNKGGLPGIGTFMNSQNLNDTNSGQQGIYNYLHSGSERFERSVSNKTIEKIAFENIKGLDKKKTVSNLLPKYVLESIKDPELKELYKEALTQKLILAFKSDAKKPVAQHRERYQLVFGNYGIIPTFKEAGKTFKEYRNKDFDKIYDQLMNVDNKIITSKFKDVYAKILEKDPNLAMTLNYHILNDRKAVALLLSGKDVKYMKFAGTPTEVFEALPLELQDKYHKYYRNQEKLDLENMGSGTAFEQELSKIYKKLPPEENLKDSFPYWADEVYLRQFFSPKENIKSGMSKYQEKYLLNLFSEYPQVKEHFQGILTTLFGHPYIANNQEFHHFVNYMNKHTGGKPQLGVIARFKNLARNHYDMLKYDTLWEQTTQENILRVDKKPVSVAMKMKDTFVQSQIILERHKEKFNRLMNALYSDDFGESLSLEEQNAYGREAKHPILTNAELPFIDKFKMIARGHLGDKKLLQKIAVFKHEYEGFKQELQKKSTVTGEDKITLRSRERRWKSVQSTYDKLPEVEKAYVNYLQRQQAKLMDYVWTNYISASNTRQFSSEKILQDVELYTLPKKISELKSYLDNNPTDIPAKNKYQYLVERYERLKEAKENNVVLNRIGYTSGYFHRSWIDKESYINAVDEKLNHYQNLLSKAKTSEQKKSYEKAIKEIKELRSKYLDSTSYNAGKLFDPSMESPADAYTLFRNNPAFKSRSFGIDGYDTDIPHVNIKYIHQVLYQGIKMKAGLQAKMELDKFVSRLEHKYPKSKPDIKRLTDFFDTYIMDNLGYITKHTQVATPAGLVKYAKDNLMSKLNMGTVKRPEEYETKKFSDVSVINKINARRIAHGYEPVPLNRLAYINNLEAKYELMSILAFPKTSIVNVVGGSINNMIMGGTKRFKQGLDRLLHDEAFKKRVEQEGIEPDYLSGEFGIIIDPIKSDYPRFVKEGKAILKNSKMDAKQKRSAIIRLGKQTGVPDNIIQKTGEIFLRKPEKFNRRLSYAIGEIMAEEQGLWGQDTSIFARRFVESTQFLYSNSTRGEFARTSIGKILTRFQHYMFQSMGLHRQVHNNLKIYGLKEGSEEWEQGRRWYGAMAIMMAMASLYPYSLFETAMPPHMEWLKDMSEVLFGTDVDRQRAFYGTYGFNVISAPMTSRLILRPLVTLMNQDLSTYLDREVWNFFPFGRLARGVYKSMQNPYYTVDRFTGIPLVGIMNSRKEVEELENAYKGVWS